MDVVAMPYNDENLPKLVVLNAYTNTVDHMTRSELAMGKMDFTIVNMNRTLRTCDLNTMKEVVVKEDDKTRTEEERTALAEGSDTNSALESTPCNTQPTLTPDSSVLSGCSYTLSSPVVTSSITPSSSTALSNTSHSTSASLEQKSVVSVRASSTLTSMVTTTRTSTRCQFHGEIMSNSRVGPVYKNTSVTYCYSNPSTSPIKTRSNKIPYKVIGKKHLDERKFARVLWQKIKDMDFPLAFAEILSHVRRVDEMGIGVCRDRLLKTLKVMIQNKRGMV